MALKSVSQANNTPHIRLRVPRARGLTRAVAWGAPAALLGIASVSLYAELDFSPSGISNRLVDYALALCMLPFTAFAVLCSVLALRWILFFLWPGSLGIFADEHGLALRLGPFGARCYRADKLLVRYPFERNEDLDEGSFEAFLPEQKQRETLLPWIEHADARRPINLEILRFSGLSEEEAARELRPFVDLWQARGSRSDEPAEGST